MKKLVVGTLLSMAIVVLLGSVKVASAVKGQAGSSQRSDFALFDGTNSANQPDSGAVCGARGTYTSYVAVSNFFWRGRGRPHHLRGWGRRELPNPGGWVL